MPSYTYECEDNHITEVFCKHSDKQDIVSCDECGKDATQVILEPNKAHTRGCSEAPTKN